MYEQTFPFLKNTNWKITSIEDVSYNCIAWAAHDNTKWWWPKDFGYWPNNVPREETINAFILAYESIGFQKCTNSSFQKGYEKIAIYVNKEDEPTHAARQKSNGRWTSKLGARHDIEHDLYSLNNSPTYTSIYGEPKIFLKRKISYK